MAKKWLKFCIELQIILFIAIFGNNMQPFIAIFGNFCHEQIVAIFGNLVKQKIARNGKKVT